MPTRHTHYGARVHQAKALPGPRPAKRTALEARAAERTKRARGTRR